MGTLKRHKHKIYITILAAMLLFVLCAQTIIGVTTAEPSGGTVQSFGPYQNAVTVPLGTSHADAALSLPGKLPATVSSRAAAYTEDIAVTWTSAPAWDANTPGVYTFTATGAGGQTDASWPVHTITVLGAGEESKADATHVLPGIDISALGFSGTLPVTITPSPETYETEIEVSWKCDTYTPDIPGEYTFTAAFAKEGFTYTGNMPAATVTVSADGQTPSPSPSPETGIEEPEKPQPDKPDSFPEGIEPQGSNETITLTDEQIAETEKLFPTDISSLRREIALRAYSLTGHVKYFWGGKSLAIGWDERWGNAALVSSAGSPSTGTVRAYGTDCSGFVLWSMINGFYNVNEDDSFDTGSIVSRVGYGTAGQWGNSTEITWEEALPGDLLFYKSPSDAGTNHVGVVIGRDEDGNLMVCHNSSSRNGVVFEKASKGLFPHARRLTIVAEDDAVNTRYRQITWEEAQKGDRLFYRCPEDNGINHAGIVTGRDKDGKLLVYHSASDDDCPEVETVNEADFGYGWRLTTIPVAVITGFELSSDTADADIPSITVDTGTEPDEFSMPKILRASVETGEENTCLIQVAGWECIGIVDEDGKLQDEDFDKDKPGTYRFVPVLALKDTERLAEGTQLPATDVVIKKRSS